MCSRNSHLAFNHPVTLDHSSSAAAAAAESAINTVNTPAVDCQGHGSRSGEGSSITATTRAAEPTGAQPSAELVMGRKKIQITQIADERNRQVSTR